MRYLKPEPTQIIIGKETYPILYTLDIIDQIQSTTKMPIIEVLEWAMVKKTMETAIICLLKFLLPGVDVKIENPEYLSTMLITAFIKQAKCKEIEGHNPPPTNGKVDFIDIERWMYVGRVVLGYPEDEVWNMTLGKIGTLHREHLKYNGAIQVEEEVSLLSI